MKQILISLFISFSLLTVFCPVALACDGKCAHTDCPNHQAEAQDSSQHPAAMASSGEKALDPVCGMMIGKPHAVDQVNYQGKTYFFCMKDEKEAFLKAPEKYLEGDESGR